MVRSRRLLRRYLASDPVRGSGNTQPPAAPNRRENSRTSSKNDGGYRTFAREFRPVPEMSDQMSPSSNRLTANVLSIISRESSGSKVLYE
jgi:hypothetical protein